MSDYNDPSYENLEVKNFQYKDSGNANSEQVDSSNSEEKALDSISAKNIVHHKLEQSFVYRSALNELLEKEDNISEKILILVSEMLEQDVDLSKEVTEEILSMIDATTIIDVITSIERKTEEPNLNWTIASTDEVSKDFATQFNTNETVENKKNIQDYDTMAQNYDKDKGNIIITTDEWKIIYSMYMLLNLSDDNILKKDITNLLLNVQKDVYIGSTLKSGRHNGITETVDNDLMNIDLTTGILSDIRKSKVKNFDGISVLSSMEHLKDIYLISINFKGSAYDVDNSFSALWHEISSHVVNTVGTADEDHMNLGRYPISYIKQLPDGDTIDYKGKIFTKEEILENYKIKGSKWVNIPDSSEDVMQKTLQKIKLRLPTDSPSEKEIIDMKEFLKAEGILFYEDIKDENIEKGATAKSKKGKEKRSQKKIERARAKKYD